MTSTTSRPAPRQLGLSDVLHRPSHHNANMRQMHHQTPTPEDEAIPLHCTAAMQLQQGPCHRYPTYHHFRSSPLPHPLTMTEAGGIAQLEDNLDDTSSVDLSNYPHSEYSFVSEGSSLSPHHNLRPLPLPSVTPIPKPNLRDALARRSHRSPPASCACSCHTSDRMSLSSPSPSVPLLHPGGHRPQRRLAQSPTLALSQPSNFQHHYSLWTERGHHYHLPNRFSPVSPV